eukprot:TRINITY_DN4597_c0_g1_i1.p2 TRINITY_DN4597_c0_g1~~TRINITY_DN4597_c0_g1_i1.p2  ORF type:complete len:144 (-),score=28.59 TRINITY_DN4597_c0_g1_i1:118-549(-)
MIVYMTTFIFFFNFIYNLSSIFMFFFFLMIRRPPRSTQSRSSAASDVYKRQTLALAAEGSCFSTDPSDESVIPLDIDTPLADASLLRTVSLSVGVVEEVCWSVSQLRVPRDVSGVGVVSTASCAGVLGAVHADISEIRMVSWY